MKQTFIHLLLLISSSFGGFSITEFKTDNAYPQLQTTYLAPNHGNYLSEQLQFSSQPTLRRGFSDSEYRLYSGKFTAQATEQRSNLQRFIRPQSMSIHQFRTTKFYSRQRINSLGDIQECYFLGDTLYIEGFVQISYFKNGTWKKLYAIQDGVTERGTGDIAVTTSPSGAHIYLDGIRHGVSTPNYLTQIEAGTHTLSLRHPDFAPRETTVTVLPNDIVQLSLSLHSRSGSVRFSGNPRGASIKLNGRTVGELPCTIDNLAPGSYEFIINSPFHLRKTISVTVRSGHTIDQTIQLAKAYGVIELPQVPINSPWTINGEMVAAGSLRFNPGTHRIYWAGDGSYQPIDTVITLSLGDTLSLNSQFKMKTGSIKVLPLPMSCELYIDGKYYGEAPMVAENLTVGKHTIELKRYGYESVRKIVHIEDTNLKTIHCSLQKRSTASHTTIAHNTPQSQAEIIAQQNRDIQQRSVQQAVQRSKSHETVVDRTGMVSFVSFPPLAKVYSGDSLVAITGKGSVPIPAGRYQFRFVSGNGESREQTVIVSAGDQRAVLVNFQD